jgi:hypothetical protein
MKGVENVTAELVGPPVITGKEQSVDYLLHYTS